MTPTEEATLFLAASRWVTLRSVEQDAPRSEALEALQVLLRVAREVDPAIQVLEKFRQNVNQHSDPTLAEERARAERYGRFWLPCPNCGRWFGGHEPHGGSFWVDPIRARICCPRCPGQYGAAPLHQAQGPQGVLEARARALNHQGPGQPTAVSAPPEMGSQKRNR